MGGDLLRKRQKETGTCVEGKTWQGGCSFSEENQECPKQKDSNWPKKVKKNLNSNR